MSLPQTSQPQNSRATGIATGLPFETPPSGQRQADSRSLPRWRALVGVLLNPGGARAGDIAFIPWLLTLFVSGAAFGLFFLQTGLDRLSAGTADWAGVGLLAALGCVFGTLGVLSLALVAWILLSLGGSKASPKDVIRAFALAYSPTLVAVSLGLVAHLLLGWRTAVAFGVTGVLWALGPINSTLRRMSGGRTLLSLALASACGALLLLGWGLLGGL